MRERAARPDRAGFPRTGIVGDLEGVVVQREALEPDAWLARPQSEQDGHVGSLVLQQGGYPRRELRIADRKRGPHTADAVLFHTVERTDEIFRRIDPVRAVAFESGKEHLHPCSLAKLRAVFDESAKRRAVHLFDARVW
jgi:hypothetical protein